MGDHQPKPDVVVTVVGMVVVAARAPGVPTIVVEGTAAQHPVSIGPALQAGADLCVYPNGRQ